jgi:hypothetical protein
VKDGDNARGRIWDDAFYTGSANFIDVGKIGWIIERYIS